MQDILNGSYAQGAKIKSTLATYRGLEAFHAFPDRRVGLASERKAFTESHHIHNEISSTIEAALFVPHGPEYRYHDAQHPNLWIDEQGSNLSLTRYCRPRLPSGPFLSLLETVQSSNHSQNHLIARQSNCPPSIGTHEFLAYGSMRAGQKLQWVNLLRTLIIGDIDLNSASSVSLIEQLVNQAGTASQNSDDSFRISHQEIQNEKFCQEIQHNIQVILDKVERNWKEANSVRCCLSIMLRLVSLTTSDDIIYNGLHIIKQIRRVVLNWALELETRCLALRRQHAKLADLQEFQRRVLDTALLARATWQVECPLQGHLFSSSSDFADYVTASILVFDYQKLCASFQDDDLRWTLMRDQALSVDLEQTVRALLPQMKHAASKGIRVCWKELHVEPNWTTYGDKFSHWITSTIADSRKPVHLNLFTGELLIAGSPVSMLPESYTQSSVYEQVFGSATIDVVASDLPWMEFMTVGLLDNNRIYFGRSEGEYVIQCAQQSTLYEAINRSVFCDDLPTTIVRKTLPWICLSNGFVEFREPASPWARQRTDWMIQPSTRMGDSYSMSRHKSRGQVQSLIDVAKPFGLTISEIFKGIEGSNNLEISYENKQQSLRVELPRYNLTFALDNESGSFRCQELAAEIDTDQTIGTFFGLMSRLVLSSASASRADPKRLLLIPWGPLETSSLDDHVQVDINVENHETVEFFQYKVDSNLCRIDTDGGIEAHLFKAYLHAVTSSCLADILTGETGTDQAIDALKDSVSLTSIPISKRANEILEAISQLTPVRKFYPDAKSKIVQRTYWNDSLPSLSQHDGFSEMAMEIGTHSILAHFLFEGDKETVPEYSGNQELRARALARTSIYLPSSYVTDDVSRDETYTGRDRNEEKHINDVYRIMSSLVSWSLPTVPLLTDVYAIMEPFGSVSGFHEAFVPAGLADLLTIDLSIHFPALLGFCTIAQQRESYATALQLSLIAFGNSKLIRIINTLAAFAVHAPLKELGLPPDARYDLSLGPAIDKGQIRELLDYHQIARSVVGASFRGADEDEHVDYIAQLNIELDSQRDAVLQAVKNAWPHAELVLPSSKDLSEFSHLKLREEIGKLYEEWCLNHTLKAICSEYASVLQDLSPSSTSKSRPSLEIRNEKRLTKQHVCYPKLLQIFGKIDTSLWQDRFSSWVQYSGSLKSWFQVDDRSNAVDAENTAAQNRLGGLLDQMQDLKTPGISGAVDVLKSGLRILRSISSTSTAGRLSVRQDFLEAEHLKMTKNVRNYLIALHEALKPITEADQGFEAAGLWPAPTSRAILKLLSSEERSLWSEASQDILFGFAQTISAKQRIGRLLHFKSVSDEFALGKEVENDAHSSWDIRQHPDWLLLELQNDFLIRPVQIRIAQEIMAPRNGVVQLGMGEGKTSVILPMVITAISEGTRLVRVVVLKSLANEMLRSLAYTLSGLINRPVFYLPFSRKTSVTNSMLKTLSVIRDQIKNSRGVLLTLPEHLNSFRLMANDRVVANDRHTMQSMLGCQKGFDNSAIDIMDECDEILHPRNELIYTSGTPRPLQGVPERWNILLDILDLIEKSAGTVAANYPGSIEYSAVSVNAFPRIRILTDEGYKQILSSLIWDIQQDTFLYLRLSRCDWSLTEAVLRFICNLDVDSKTSSVVHQTFRKQEQIGCLYLLRGMIAFGHLRAVLEKRWFVNYGLDSSRRCLSAVPYRAKSTPAAAAEFAQPDVMILFTALSYYYGGIQFEDLRHCVALLLRSADPMEEYSKWIDSSSAPHGYDKVTALNIESSACIEHLFSALSMNKRVISFFLKRVVFPREAKEFPHKLCSSAWDLCAGGPNRTVSGFSGTCDVLLPLTMTKQDIPELRHYDASVLVDLLKERNNNYVCAGMAGGRMDTGQLLELVSRHHSKPSVVIDVGAQILDTNKDVAKQWLALRRDKKACVFFNDNNEKMVMGSAGTEDPWKSSPWKEQVQQCLIFLDEFHTRGTDFQLPDNFTAAVLLGPNLRKDTLVQACMRMRKLAFSQSLIFVGSPEVDQSIRSLLNCSPDHEVDTNDIIRWSIHQSCIAKEQQRPLWVDRGLAYMQRSYASEKWVQPSGKVYREPYLQAILEDENHALSTLYSEPKGGASFAQVPSYRLNRSDAVTQELLKEQESCQAVGALLSFGEHEQEREILHEVEQEREVERPDAMNPRRPKINEELHEIIISTRSVYRKPESLRTAFEVLEYTSLRHQYHASQWPPYLLATEDYLYPVKIADGSNLDDFLRPVTWVLTLRGLPHLILISCHEANEYMDDIKRSSVATLIPYHPRVHRSSGSFDSLDVYQISAMPSVSHIDPKARTALRLYAGQLYFNDFQEYTDFCLLLGLWNGKVDLGNRVALDATNYVPARIRAVTKGWTGKWKASPVELVRKFIGMRRQNEEWAHTHVGRVLDGQILTERDF